MWLNWLKIVDNCYKLWDGPFSSIDIQVIRFLSFSGFWLVHQVERFLTSFEFKVSIRKIEKRKTNNYCYQYSGRRFSSFVPQNISLLSLSGLWFDNQVCCLFARLWNSVFDQYCCLSRRLTWSGIGRFWKGLKVKACGWKLSLDSLGEEIKKVPIMIRYAHIIQGTSCRRITFCLRYRACEMTVS